MAMFSRILLKRIAANIAAKPLAEGEFRGIEGMGGYYISKVSAWDTLKPMFLPQINGDTHYIYYRPE